MIDLPTNKIYNCDCLDLMRDMPDGYVNLIFTSPPYSVGKEYDVYKDHKPLDQYLEFVSERFNECIRVLSPGGHLVINVGNTGRNPYTPLTYFIGTKLWNNIRMRGEIIWNKDHTTNNTAWGSWMSANKPSLRDFHEYILVFRKDGNRKGKSDITKDEFIQYTKSIWSVSPKSNSWHPAPFPIKLASRVIKLFSFVGEIVFDPFSGSGTTCQCASRLGRRYIGSDISKDYVDRSTEIIKLEESQLNLNLK